VANALAQRVNGVLRRLPSWPLYFVGLTPAVVYFYWAVGNQLGVDPLATLERQLGKWALQLLILTLLVTPLRKLSGISLLKFRRAFGLMAFFYVCFHLLTWLVLDKQFFWGEILKDLYKRPYIIIGMTAFLVLIPLAITSNNASIRRLGARNWGRLHRLGYVAAAFGAVHYLLLVKAWPPEPIIYCLIVSTLLLWRVGWQRFIRSAA
jgi:sulfoxide reductase heme-binding subunit YedZ